MFCDASPTQEQLLTEAALESLAPGIEASFSLDDDPESRLEAVRSIMSQAVANERLLRTMIRLTVERGPDDDASARPAARGSRRVEWLESALAPVRPQLSKAAFSRLFRRFVLWSEPKR